MQIASNRVASFEFRVSDGSGVLLDSSEESGPYPYLHGVGHLIPGLESQMEGRSPNESFTVSVAPVSGYGERDESMVQKIPRDRFSEVDELYEGMMVEAHYENETRIMTVTHLDDEWITLDGNHPLAGISLYFEVTIKEVREATPEEIEQGIALW